MRLFVALEVPARVRDAVAEAVAPLRREHRELRWTRPDRWHVTLAFLGEVSLPVDHVVQVVTVGTADAPATIDLSLGEAGRFGSRVLWLGVRDEPHGAVAEVGERVQAALASADLPVDRKPVRAHLTLARSRSRSAPVRPGLVAACPGVEGAWSVRETVLFASHLGGGPARYEELARVPLGG